MIIVKLMGGLGNQLFQYAAGRALSEKHHTDLKFDIEFLIDRSPRENFTYRNFELDKFSIHGDIASKKEVRFYTNKNKLFQFVNHLFFSKPKVKYHYLPTFPYDDKFDQLPNNTYLEGFWQSEKYFKAIKSLISKELTIVNLPNKTNSSLLECIKDQQAVSVHIRRGDYVTNKIINEYHGICDLEYYNKAIELIAEKTYNPVFYFFSDDINWVKSNYPEFKYPHEFISHNTGSSSFEDLRLMIACKHNIIANSSFSWWGAWLNNNPEKIVIAPSNWFSNTEIDTSDLIPEDWIKL